jgi:predicted enzyme related to lactoylglutathione lyase
MGEASVTMFRLPGYVGGEPEQPVSREVVATMMPGEEGTAPRWVVDFWVHDVDGAAATAERRGGSATAPPFDLPIARTAVLADPAGVEFSITKVSAAG